MMIPNPLLTLSLSLLPLATALRPRLNASAASACGAPMSNRTAQDIVTKLAMLPNPEKGYYAETFRDPALVPGSNSSRSVGTAIYYLLEGSAGQSVWHRLDASEIWHWYAGAPLTLYQSADNGTGIQPYVLGPDLFAADGQRPQVVVPTGIWQSALSHGAWTLVGTTVAPAFIDSGSELADPGWVPT
ncbi:RmlC-like cupin domain-containing protein [Xylariomycetidae sp. FL2044]|nr:RmlC-like cupin domain-containing protein [Xylariomycetidae sp. FL2044]